MYDTTKPYKKQILDMIKQTWNTPYVSVREGLYPIFEEIFNYPMADHTDGIGTKGLYHWRCRTFRNAALDALAMNLNDSALVRARPYKLQDHITVQADDREAVLNIVEALVQECRNRKIAITGGETSVQNSMEGLDVSIAMSGFIENERQNIFEAGDVLMGIASSGLHANGFTKVRETFDEEHRAEFVEPTRIYDNVLEVADRSDVHGMMHITGGAFTKLKDVMKGTDVVINKDHKLQPQRIFRELYERGVSDYDMYSTFNCGIGFVLSAEPGSVDEIVSALGAGIIGTVTHGSGKIKIESAFSDREVVF